MFSVGICDDDRAVCAFIENVILNYGRLSADPVKAEVFYSGAELLSEIDGGKHFDMLFLDIKLQDTSGIDIGNWIRDEKQNESVKLVYISSEREFAMDLFESRPMNFLIKPLKREMIVREMDKGLRLSQIQEQRFCYKKGRGQVRVPVKSILYFESIDKRVKIVTAGETDYFYSPLREVYLEVEKYHFFYCHKAYLVNYYQVARFKNTELTMSDGTVLPVAQAKRKEVRRLQMEIEAGK